MRIPKLHRPTIQRYWTCWYLSLQHHCIFVSISIWGRTIQNKIGNVILNTNIVDNVWITSPHIFSMLYYSCQSSPLGMAILIALLTWWTPMNVLACFLEACLIIHEWHNLYCSRNWKLYNDANSGKHSKMPPSFRKVSCKLNKFSRSNRHICLSRTVDGQCQAHSWKSLCCLMCHHIIMNFCSSRGYGILPRSWLTLLGIINEGRCAMSADDGCMSQDQRQHPFWAYKKLSTPPNWPTKETERKTNRRMRNRGDRLPVLWLLAALRTKTLYRQSYCCPWRCASQRQGRRVQVEVPLFHWIVSVMQSERMTGRLPLVRKSSREDVE